MASVNSSSDRVSMIADLWGLSQSAIEEKLTQMKLFIADASDETLLDYLSKYDLDIQKAINSHFNNAAFMPAPPRADVVQSEQKSAQITDDTNQINNKSPEKDGKPVCPICQASMSPFLIDNHRRHCQNNYKKQQQIEQENNDKPVEETPPPQADRNDNYREEYMAPQKPELIACRFCEFECARAVLQDHEYQCGARTDVCDVCGKRDTLLNITDKIHRCHNAMQPPSSTYSGNSDNRNGSSMNSSFVNDFYADL
eukprot:255615_1